MEFYWAFYGYWMLKEEQGQFLIGWLLFGSLQALYALWKVNDFTWIRTSKYAAISSTVPFMAILGSVSIVFRVAVLAISFYLSQRFGSGLKEALSTDTQKTRERSNTFVN